jgi:hypothetical protein
VVLKPPGSVAKRVDGGLSADPPLLMATRISRTNTAATYPVRGTIRLTALGLRRDLPFTLSGRQVVASTLIVERKTHLEPVRAPILGR